MNGTVGYLDAGSVPAQAGESHCSLGLSTVTLTSAGSTVPLPCGLPADWRLVQRPPGLQLPCPCSSFGPESRALAIRKKPLEGGHYQKMRGQRSLKLCNTGSRTGLQGYSGHTRDLQAGHRFSLEKQLEQASGIQKAGSQSVEMGRGSSLCFW